MFKKVKWSRYRPGVAQRVGRGIALLFHDRDTSVVSSTPRPRFTPGNDPVPILQEAWWTPRSVWTAGKSRPHRDSIPDLPARSQSLYRLSYPPHMIYYNIMGPPSYVLSVVDQNIVMRRIPFIVMLFPGHGPVILRGDVRCDSLSHII